MDIIITEEHLTKILNESSPKQDERDKIYQDENIVVVAPLNHRASCKYGAYTKWCTAVPSNDEHFNEYMRHGVLIYFIVRSPYKNSAKPEYKFAYYHPFDEEMSEGKGWYDMTDNQLGNEDSRIDMNLIKFLIPDEIMSLVKDYIKKQKPIWKEKQKIERTSLGEYLMNDPNNIPIVNNSKWFICYRTVKLDDRYDSIYLYISPKDAITIIYYNKKTNNIYYQTLQYYIDLRNFEGGKSNSHLDRIVDVYLSNNDLNMLKVFEMYYPEILKAFFKGRKENFVPQRNGHIYIPPKYLIPGKDFAAGSGGYDGAPIIDVRIDPKTGKYAVDTKDNKNSYYNDDIGFAVKYDKERHNPI